MKIAGQGALVTGGGSGLGAATAQLLSEAGAEVVVFDRDEAAATQVADRIGGIAQIGDVTSEADLAEALDRMAAPRILVTCAGIAPAARTVGRDGAMPLAMFEQVIAVNLTGTLNAARLAAKRMAELDPLDGGDRGVIVMTASVAAYEGQIGQVAYAASKGGVAAMTLPMARDLAGQSIRVMTIAPGLFGTPMLRGLPSEVQASLSATVPYPARLGEPEEFAKTVRFCVETGYLNGSVIRLDGALRMAPR